MSIPFHSTFIIFKTEIVVINKIMAVEVSFICYLNTSFNLLQWKIIGLSTLLLKYSETWFQIIHVPV